MAQVEQNPTVSAVKTVEKLPASFKEADVAKELIVAEYNNLNDQLLKRIDIRYQMVQFILAALGVFLTVGFSIKNAALLFAFPAIVLILSIVYITNAYESRRIKCYIKQYIEPRVPNSDSEAPFGWFHYRGRHNLDQFSILMMKFGTVGNIGVKLIFFTSSLIAIGAGLLSLQLYGGAGEDFLLPSCILTVVAGMALFSESYFVDQVEKPEAALAPLNVPAAHSPESR